MKERSAAVFLDRDGVLNQDSPDFIKSPAELIILPGVPDSIARLTTAGLPCIVITNQSGVARGLVTRDDLDAMHRKLESAIECAGGKIAGFYFCPHMPGEGCDCRKPKTGMLSAAARDHAIDLNKSFLIGDKPADVECARAAGCRAILVLTGQTEVEKAKATAPDYIATDLSEAVDWILGYV